jgi:hypothetical protein
VDNGKLTVNDESHFDLSASVFGSKLVCKAEKYKYNSSSKSFSLPNTGSSSDCLGQYLQQFGVDPSVLKILYDEDVDVVSISAEGQKIQLKKCPSSALRGEIKAIQTQVQIPSVSKVCVTNDAGFVLDWYLQDLLSNAKSESTDNYPIDQTKCLELSTIPNVAIGDVVMCSVHADAGVTHFCSSAVKYINGTEQTATFTCTGTTLDYSCHLN